MNWTLMALSFALGLVLTLAFMVRRVRREVPIYGPSSAIDTAAAAPVVIEEPYGAGSFLLVDGTSVPSGWTIKGNEDSMVFHTTDSPSYDQTVAELWFEDESAAVKAGFRRWDDGPHGLGSAAPGVGGAGPAGWTVKGNEESKLYHSPESPSFGVTRAEVWFRDVETAEAAGFNRWDSGKSQRGKR